MTAVPMKKSRQAATARISETICQSKVSSSCSPWDAVWAEAPSMCCRWLWWWGWCLGSSAIDLLQSISNVLRDLQTVSMCRWHGRITISCWLHFVHWTHSSRFVSQYSRRLHVDEAKLSGINDANNTKSNDETTRFNRQHGSCRFLNIFDWCWLR